MIQVLYSSQSAMLKSALKKIYRQEAIDKTSFGFLQLEMTENKLVRLADECEYLPLGEERKVIEASNFFYLDKTKTKAKIQKGDTDETLLRVFENPPSFLSLYLLVYSDSLDERSPFYKALLKGGARFSQVASFSENEWRSFSDAYFKKRGLTLLEDAKDLLLERTGGDYASFLNEANKLVAYVETGNVTKKDVEALVPALLEEDSFALQRALSKGDKGEALSIYKDYKVRSGNSAVTLLNRLSNEYRFLSSIALLSKQGYDSGSIMREMGVSYGRVNAAFYTLRKLSLKKIHEASEAVYQALFSIMTGKMGEDLAFSLLLANFPTA